MFQSFAANATQIAIWICMGSLVLFVFGMWLSEPLTGFKRFFANAAAFAFGASTGLLMAAVGFSMLYDGKEYGFSETTLSAYMTIVSGLFISLLTGTSMVSLRRHKRNKVKSTVGK